MTEAASILKMTDNPIAYSQTRALKSPTRFPEVPIYYPGVACEGRPKVRQGDG